MRGLFELREGVEVAVAILGLGGGDVVDVAVDPLFEFRIRLRRQEIGHPADGLVEQAIVPGTCLVAAGEPIADAIEILDGPVSFQLGEHIGNGHLLPDLPLGRPEIVFHGDLLNGDRPDDVARRFRRPASCRRADPATRRRRRVLGGRWRAGPILTFAWHNSGKKGRGGGGENNLSLRGFLQSCAEPLTV